VCLYKVAGPRVKRCRVPLRSPTPRYELFVHIGRLTVPFSGRTPAHRYVHFIDPGPLQRVVRRRWLATSTCLRNHEMNPPPSQTTNAAAPASAARAYGFNFVSAQA
jgi:hypothetical protein